MGLFKWVKAFSDGWCAAQFMCATFLSRLYTTLGISVMWN